MTNERVVSNLQLEPLHHYFSSIGDDQVNGAVSYWEGVSRASCWEGVKGMSARWVELNVHCTQMNVGQWSLEGYCNF